SNVSDRVYSIDPPRRGCRALRLARARVGAGACALVDEARRRSSRQERMVRVQVSMTVERRLRRSRLEDTYTAPAGAILSAVGFVGPWGLYPRGACSPTSARACVPGPAALTSLRPFGAGREDGDHGTGHRVSRQIGRAHV